MVVVLRNEQKNQILIPRLKVARTFLKRGLGLIPKRELDADEGLWISKCKTIHTCFMSFAIDCVFVDKNLKVRGLARNVKPWRMTTVYWKADSVIELAAGSIDRLKIGLGDQLNVES